MIKAIRVALAALFLAVAIAPAIAQPGGPGGGGPGPVPPPSPWIYASPLIYPPAGSCVVIPSTVAGGCVTPNSINVSGNFYRNGVAFDFISIVTPPLNFSAGTLSLNFNSSLALDGSNNLGFNLSHSNIFSAPQIIDLGSGTGEPAADTGAGLSIYGANGTAARTEVTAFGAAAVSSLRSSPGNRGASTTITPGYLIASLNVHGFDGSIWGPAFAAIHTYGETSNWTSTSHPTETCIATTTTVASASNADVLCVHANAGVTIGSPTGGSIANAMNNSVGYYVNGAPIAPTTGGLTGQVLGGVTSSAPIWTGAPTLTTSLTVPEVIAPAGSPLLLAAPSGFSVQFAPNGGGGTVVVNGGGLLPVNDNSIALGGSGNRWANIYGALATVGAATVTTINNLTITSSTGTLTIAGSKVLTINNSLSFIGTDATTMTFPITSATIARTDAGQTFTGLDTFSNGLTVLSSFTATGLVTNADLVSASITVNGATCTLGSSCSPGAGAIAVGDSLTGGTPNGLLFNSANTIGNLATANSGVLVTSAGGVPSISTTLPSGLTAPSLTVTVAFTATGLVTNADLANSSLTINGVNVALGASGTITAAPSGAAGGDLTGTYPNPTLATVNSNVGTFGSPTSFPVITVNAKGLITAVATNLVRAPLTGNTNIYVNGDSVNSQPCNGSTCSKGSDSNNGLTIGAPFLHGQNAVNAAQQLYDGAGFGVTIVFADAASASAAAANYSVACNGAVIGNPFMFLQGNASTPTSVHITAPNAGVGVFAGDGCEFKVTQIEIDDAGSATNAIKVSEHAIIDVVAATFGAFNTNAGTSIINATKNGVINFNVASSTFLGGGTQALLADNTGIIQVNTGIQLNFPNSASFTNVASAINGGLFKQFVSTTFNVGGTITTTGPRALFNGSVLNFGGSLCSSVFPGSTPCSFAGFATDDSNEATMTLVGGTLANGANVANITATQPTSPVASQVAVLWTINSAGSASQTNTGFQLQYAAGYTGSSRTQGATFNNVAAGTGSTFIPAAGTQALTANIGANNQDTGTTTGTNIGNNGAASGGNVNIGIEGISQIAKASAINIGVLGSAVNTGGTSAQVGGYFTLNGSQPTNTTPSAALITDNGSQSNPTAIFMCAGVQCAAIGATGHIVASGTAPTISACGTGSPTISGGDNFGKVVAGTVATSCVINFGAAWGSAPSCNAASGTAIASLTVSATTTQLTITGTALGGDTITWICGSTAALEPGDLPGANDNWPPGLSKAA